MIYSTLIALVIAIAPPPAGYDPAPLLDAIEHVETGSCADPANAVGDGGKALGPLQIHRVYWLDAIEHDPSLIANGETYQSVRCRIYARRVVMAYWSRYAKSWDPETLSRIHNGGPKGHRKAATLGYWSKVKSRLGA